MSIFSRVARISPIPALIALALAATVGLGHFAQAATTPETSWQPRQPGYIVETVAGGLRLPVDIAFVPHAGTAPDSPWFYVTELYGSVKVVTREGTVADYATGLLNYSPSSSFPGAGEVGLAGIVVEPVTGDVIVSVAYQDGGTLHPEVLRLHSADGGLTASSSSVLLSMPALTLTTSHMASNLSIGPDGKLFVHVGDAGVPGFSQDPDSFGGKVLRMELDGRPSTDNPMFSAADGITARDYVYASGLRNPFGGDWRSADGHHYAVENGPGVDRFARILSGGNLGYDGTDQSMANGASYLWSPAHAPVNLAFVQASVFGGSGFPAEKRDHAFVSEFGSYWASGPSVTGKRISEFALDADGHLVSGPVPLIEFTGSGKATAVGLAAGQDGLYFTDLFADSGSRFDDTGAHVLRVRYVGAVATAPATITVTADPAVARERHLRPGTLIISRTGDTSVALPVAYTVGGTAQPGVEYQPLSGLVVIPAGASAASVDVMPIQDTIAYGDQTVVVTLTAGSASAVGTPSSATVLLRDDDRVTRATITIDQATRFQTITGIGGNFATGRFTGSPQANDPVGVATLARLAPTHARVGIPLKGYAPASINPSTPDLGYVDAGDVHNVFLLLQDMQRRGIPIVASVWDAPDWMVADATKTTARTLAPGMEAPFVAALTSFLAHAHDLYGIDIQAVSLNEADSGFNLLVPASQASSLAAHAVHAFRARGLIAGWIAGDATGITADYPYASPTLDDAQSRPVLVALGLHTWDAESRPDAAFAGVAALASSHGLPVWATEIGYDSQVYRTNPATFSTWDNAWRLALVTQRTVTVGRASVLDFWSYQNDYPLADPANGRLYPAGVVVKQLSDRLQPGMHLVAATPDAPVLQAFAAVDEGRNAFMTQLINTSARPARIVVTGLPDRDLALVRSSRFERIMDLGSRRARGGRLTLTLPGQSISSLSGDLHAGRPDQPPVVDAGPDQNLSSTLPIPLNGMVHDDGRPAGSTLTIAWTVDSGPGPVHFANPAAAATTATISVPGVYRLRLTAGDGQLSASASVLISALGADLHVNFQPANAAVPAGYVPDSGKVFADRGNGFQYGWANANSAAFVRSSQVSPDQRYDTGIATAAAARWEIVVPNGDYLVHLVAGDATNGSANEQFLAEGIQVLSGVLSATRHWVESTTRVTVSDGRLTIAPAPAAVAASLAFVDIVPVPVTPPEVAFNAPSASILENAGAPLLLSVDLSHAYPLPVTVAYQVSGGSALPGTNVNAIPSGTLTFASGSTRQVIPVQPLDDHVYGRDTTVMMALSAPTNAVLGANVSAAVTIADADPVPTFAFSQANAQVPETTGAISLPVTLSAVSALPVTVTYSITGGSAQSGINYQPLAAGQLTFQPGQLSAAVPFVPVDDHIHNPDLTVVVSLSLPVGAALGGTTNEVLTIADADPLPVLSFTQPSLSVAQSIGSVTLPVSLNGLSGVPVTATILQGGGTAVAGTDFQLTSPVITIAPGATAFSIPLTILASGASDDRTLTLTFADVQGATIAPTATTTITIQGSGRPAVVSFGAATGQGNDAITSVSVQVLLDQARPVPLVVPFHVAGGNAIQGPAADPTSDYALPSTSVIIPAGETAALLTFAVVDRSIPEFPKSLVLQLDASANVTLGAQPTFSYTIINDDLPAPVIQLTQGTAVAASAFGLVPDGYAITHLVVVAPSGFSHTTGTIDNGGFIGQVGNSTVPAANINVSFAFADDAGHVGPSTAATIAFGDGAGGAVSTGDPMGLPAGTPTVAATITSGLTGEKTGTLNGEAVSFTNNSAGPVTLSLTATAEPGAVTSIQLVGDDGSVYPATGGTVTLPILPEGRYAFTAQAVAQNGNSTAYGSSSKQVILIVDTTPPVLNFTIAKRYWSKSVAQSANPPASIPMRTTLTNVQDLVLLNGNGDSDNIPLRDERHMNVFDVGGFTAEATIDDLSGIDSDASPSPLTPRPVVTAAPSAVAFTLSSAVSPETGSAQTITISGFSGLLDSVTYDPSTLALLTQRGRYTLHVRLQDRAGNILDSDQFKLWVKRVAPSAQVGAYSASSDFINRYTSLGAFVEISPARWIVSTPDAAFAWQDSVGDGNLLPRELFGPTNPDSTGLFVPSFSGWRLLRPVPVPTDGAASISMVVEDFLGNRSSGIARTVQRRSFDIRYHGPPEGSGGRDFLFQSSGYGNNVSASERPILDSRQPPPDSYAFIIGKSSDTILQKVELSLLGKGGDLKEGIREGWLDFTTDPNDYWNGARVTNVELSDAPTGQVYYSMLLVNPIDPGTGDQRLANPGVITIPPSWQTVPSNVLIQVHDKGVAAIPTGSPALSIQSQHQDAHVSAPSLTASIVTIASGKAVQATMPVRRMAVDPQVAPVQGKPPTMVEATEPGFARVTYSMTNFNTYPQVAYNSSAGFRWINFIRMTPDILQNGTKSTIRIEAAFLDDTLTIANFNKNGDYVHFVANGSDITLAVANYNPTADASTRAGKIAIMAQRLVVQGKNSSLVQALELDLDIAQDAPAVLCDVDVKLGAVFFHGPTPGYENATDQNPDPFKGANGAHRMTKALSMCRIVVNPIEVWQLQDKQYTIQVSGKGGVGLPAQGENVWIDVALPHLSDADAKSQVKALSLNLNALEPHCFYLKQGGGPFSRQAAPTQVAVDDGAARFLGGLAGETNADQLHDSGLSIYDYTITGDLLTQFGFDDGIDGQVTVSCRTFTQELNVDTEFQKAPFGGTSLFGNTATVTVGDTGPIVPLMPDGSSVIGSNTNFSIGYSSDPAFVTTGDDAADPVQGNDQAAPILSWTGPSSFVVSGDRIGDTMIQVFPIIDAKVAGTASGGSISPILEIPIQVDFPILSEPGFYQVGVARRNQATRKSWNGGDDLQQEDTPHIPDNGGTDAKWAMPTKFPTIWGEPRDKRTLDTDDLDAVFEFCMHMMAEVVPTGSGGQPWYAPVVGNNSLINLPISGSNRDTGSINISIEQYRRMWNSGSDCSDDDVVAHLLNSGPPIQQWLRFARHATLDNGWAPRTDAELVRQRKILELKLKSYMDEAALMRLLRYFSMTYDYRSQLTAGFTDVVSPFLTGDPYFNEIPMQGADAAIETDTDALTKILDQIGKSGPINRLFAVGITPDWYLGHPYTEEVLRHLISERMIWVTRLLNDMQKDALNGGSDWPITIEHRLLGPTAPMSYIPLGFDHDPNGRIRFKVPSRFMTPPGVWETPRFVLNGITYPDLVFGDGVKGPSSSGAGSIGFDSPNGFTLRMYHTTNSYTDLGIRSSTLAGAMVIRLMTEIQALERMESSRESLAFWQDFEKQAGEFGYGLFCIGEVFVPLTDVWQIFNKENFETGQPLSGPEYEASIFATAVCIISGGVPGSSFIGRGLGLLESQTAKGVIRTAASNMVGLSDDLTRAVSELGEGGASITQGTVASRTAGRNARVAQDALETAASRTSSYLVLPIETLTRLQAGVDCLSDRIGVWTGSQAPHLNPNCALGNAAKHQVPHPAAVRTTPTPKTRDAFIGANRDLAYDQRIRTAFASSLDEICRRVGPTNCFPWDTPVLLANGSWRAINEVKVGERVMSRDQGDPEGDLEGDVVTAVMVEKATEIMALAIVDEYGRTGSVRTTPGHPFWKMGKGWTAAKDVAPGDHLRGSHGQLTVTEISGNPGVLQVYNLAVERSRTFLVGAISGRGPPLALWVHNNCALRAEFEKDVRERAVKLGITLSDQEVIRAIDELAKRHLKGNGRGILVQRAAASISNANVRKVVTGIIKSDGRVFYTTEGLVTSGKRLPSQVYELKCPHALAGTLADGSRVRIVPSLKYTNPAGRDFVKFDAIDPESPFVLIDRKLNIASFDNAQGVPTLKTSQEAAFRRQAKALRDSDNSLYSIQYEVPSQFIADRMDALIKGIMPQGRYKIVVRP